MGALLFPSRRIVLVCATVLLAFIVGGQTRADDWPNWMGPARDNEWRETGIAKAVPAGGFKVLWRAKVEGGYAGPAVAAGRVYVTDYVSKDDVKVDNFQRKEYTGTERVLCLDEKSGKELWKHEYPVRYTISYPAGPRCTPVVEENRVYTLGAEGDLICFNTQDGKVIWKKQLREEYNTKAALWGYASHPLIDGQKLIVLAGGKGSHVVALDKLTGKELWRSLSAPEQGYSPPTIIEANGVRQLLIMRPDAISSINPETGKEYWSVPYTADNGSIIMTPVRWRDHLFVGGFNGRNLMLRLNEKEPGATVEWQDEKQLGMSPVNVQPRMDGDVMYGFDASGELMALAMPSGERIWKTSAPVGPRKEGSGTAFLVKQADRYWMFNERGEIVLAKLSPKGYEELGRTKVIEPTNNAFGRKVVWCQPAFANKHMYVRNDAECICVDLSEGATK